MKDLNHLAFDKAALFFNHIDGIHLLGKLQDYF